MESIREVVAFQQRRHMPKRALKGHSDVIPSLTSETLKILEPKTKKLSSIDTQRIMAIFVDCIKKIELITVFHKVIQNVDRFRVSLGSETVEFILKHKILVSSFNEIKEQTTKLIEQQQQAEEEDDVFEDTFNVNISTEDENRFQSGDSLQSVATQCSVTSRTDAALNNLQFVAGQIQANCRDILRALYKTPTSKSVVDLMLKEYHCHRSIQADKILSYMNQLKEQVMSRLLMTAIEEDEKMNYVREVFERERRNSVKISKLESNLRSAHNDMQSYINKKNDVIHKIQDELDHVESQADEHYRRTRTEAEKQIISDIQMNESKITRLTQEKKKLETKHKELLQEHRESEMELRKRKFKTENEIENWIQKYDQDIGSRQETCEEIELVYSVVREQLSELEEVFKDMETKYKAIMEERRVKKEADDKARRELRERMNAVYVLQRFWRRYGTPPKKKKKKGKKK